MKESKRIVAIIPVKEKSERTPNKNFRSFNSAGESLFDLTLKKLSQIKSLDHIYISTDKISLNLKQTNKISIINRDKFFCNNITPWSEVIENIANSIPEKEDTIVMWCHVTNPLFNSYEDALSKFLELDESTFNSLVVVEKLKEYIVDDKGSPWNYSYGIWHKYSQDLPKLFKINGSLFINYLSEIRKTKYVINTKPFLFPIDSKFGIDIDNEWEYELAQIIYKHFFEK